MALGRLRLRSLTGLIFIGFSILAVPLLVGVVGAAIQIRRLADDSEQMVLMAVATTRQAQVLLRQVALMERTARLYQIMGRPALLDAFDRSRQGLEASLTAIEKLPGAAERAEATRALRESAATVARKLHMSSGGTVRAGIAALGEVERLAEQLAQLAGRQIDRNLLELRERTSLARRNLLWQSAALVPITLALGFLFTVRVIRPLRSIDEGISALGHGQLQQPISIRGPSDLQALGSQLEWLRVRMIEVAEERNRFLRHMSHELKTPLANIREGSELLIEGAVGGLAPEQREVAAIMRDNSLRLQRLIENLLSYSEWQARRGALEVGEFELKPLVEATLGQYQLPLGARGIRLDLAVPAGLLLRADRAKLRLVLDNLLSNAIKFTPDGGTVTLRAAARDGWLELEVADTGPGIAREDRERIFEAFYQGATPAGSLVRGTGIGLSVVQEFVRAQGGTVELVDGELPGAHFRVRLPMTVPAESTAPRVELTTP
jgi:two-component system sensor histidine kinase GlrK